MSGTLKHPDTHIALNSAQCAQAADPCHNHQRTWNGSYAGYPSLMATLYLLLLGHASFPLKLVLIVHLSLDSFRQSWGWKAFDMVFNIEGKETISHPQLSLECKKKITTTTKKQTYLTTEQLYVYVKKKQA